MRSGIRMQPRSRKSCSQITILSKDKIRTRYVPQSPAATTDTCGSGFFGSIILVRSKRRTLWPGRHLFWSKSASVSKSTATCQPTATCRPNSNSHFEIARSGGRSHLAGVRVFLGACIHRLVASDADRRVRHRSRRKQTPARCGPARRSRRVVPRRPRLREAA